MKNLLSLLAQSDFYCPEATGPVLKSQTEFLVVIYLYAKLGHMLFLYSQTLYLLTIKKKLNAFLTILLILTLWVK
jgi:hypothetical protein